MNQSSTICAISTAPGQGAVALIRVSGEKAIDICETLFVAANKKKLTEQESGKTILGNIFSDKENIDEVLLSLFRAPHSYTGENVIEIACHGSIYIQHAIIQLLIQKGAVAAQAGEFTMRAFLNHKIDLSQAEGIADLISSQSSAAHRTALNQLKGGISNKLHALRNMLVQFISLVELELDFSEEDVEFADRGKLKLLVEEIYTEVQRLKNSFSLGNAIKHGIPTAIIGKPNTGKSTLLNYLLQEERAIVSEIPGTTRDSIEDIAIIHGIAFRFIDTAGIRETNDSIEILGIERSFEKIHKASIILLMVDAEDCLSEINMMVNAIRSHLESHQHLVLLINKTDQFNEIELQTKFGIIDFNGIHGRENMLLISAKNGIHIDQLETRLLAIIHAEQWENSDVIITNSRHFEALTRSSEALEKVLEGMQQKLSGDFLAQDIRQVLHYIGEITGAITNDEILGAIFSKFCIGK